MDSAVKGSCSSRVYLTSRSCLRSAQEDVLSPSLLFEAWSCRAVGWLFWRSSSTSAASPRLICRFESLADQSRCQTFPRRVSVALGRRLGMDEACIRCDSRDRSIREDNTTAKRRPLDDHSVKYGLKGLKSIAKKKLVESEPPTSGTRGPARIRCLFKRKTASDHPHGSGPRASHRGIGKENIDVYGYENQVTAAYSGMDLKNNIEDDRDWGPAKRRPPDRTTGTKDKDE